MAFPYRCAFVFMLLMLLGCADDLQGVQGEPGQDASAVLAIAANRPSYQRHATNIDQVIVSASENLPSRVAIDDTVLSNTETKTVELSGNGRGGLDEPSTLSDNTIYYLYAIVDEAEEGFDLIASDNIPDQGPTGFSSWSYLGAILYENATRGIVPFYRVGTELFFTDYYEWLPTFDDDTFFGGTFKESIPTKPSTVDIVKVHLVASTNGAESQNEFQLKIQSATGPSYVEWAVRNDGTTPLEAWYALDLPISNSEGKIWYNWELDTAADWQGKFALAGWHEDPTFWK